MDQSESFGGNGEPLDTLASRLRGFILKLGGQSRNPATPASIAEDTQALARFAVRCSLGGSISDGGAKSFRRPMAPRTRTEHCLAASIRRMHDKHALLFGSMMTRLHISRRVDFYQGFTELAGDLFGEEEVNWAKVVALYAFGARLGRAVCGGTFRNDIFFLLVREV